MNPNSERLHQNSKVDRPQIYGLPDQQKPAGPVARWFGATIRHWKRRKMIAALHAMDNRLLHDIGIERCDIERIVDEFDDRELGMAPVAPRLELVDLYDFSPRKAA